MNSTKIRLSVLALIFANIIWGASFPIYKITLLNIPPFTFVFLRFFLGGLILLPFIYKNLKVDKSDYKNLFLLSIFGITITISFLNFGLKFSSSINAPIILSAAPIVLIIGSFFYLKEKIKRKIVFGTLISLLGILTIILIPIFEKGLDGSVSGSLFLVIATIGSVMHALFLKKILQKYNPMTIVFWSFIIGIIPIIPFVGLEYSQTHWLNSLSFQSLGGIIFSVILATSIAHYIYAYGIKYIDASEIGIFSYVDPIATIIVATIALHEVITLPYILGSFLVFSGIFIAEGRIHYHPINLLKFKN